MMSPVGLIPLVTETVTRSNTLKIYVIVERIMTRESISFVIELQTFGIVYLLILSLHCTFIKLFQK